MSIVDTGVASMALDSKWRLEMGDYLRPPNTDLQLLAPLIFSNQPMADRMGSAFFLWREYLAGMGL